MHTCVESIVSAKEDNGPPWEGAEELATHSGTRLLGTVARVDSGSLTLMGHELDMATYNLVVYRFDTEPYGAGEETA